MSSIENLTLEEKAALTSGADFWTTKAVGDIPSIMLTDGPHGVRKQRVGNDHLGILDSVPATCFPPAVALGSSFDVELLERVGVALGEESKALGVGVLLGPGINIKRSPLCGRNFEYLSEDPIVSGVLGSALVRGHAVAGRRRLAQALRRQQPGDRPDAGVVGHRPAPAARDLPARVPEGRAGRAAVDRHVLVQPHQRRPRVAGPVAAQHACCATSGASKAWSSPTGAPWSTASRASRRGSTCRCRRPGESRMPRSSPR